LLDFHTHHKVSCLVYLVWATFFKIRIILISNLLWFVFLDWASGYCFFSPLRNKVRRTLHYFSTVHISLAIMLQWTRKATAQWMQPWGCLRNLQSILLATLLLKTFLKAKELSPYDYLVLFSLTTILAVTSVVDNMPNWLTLNNPRLQLPPSTNHGFSKQQRSEAVDC